MDLPRELRDIVYRELLLPLFYHQSLRDGRKRYYRIQPTILRVCKQAYNESSKVMYEETKWVLVATFEDGKGFITCLKEETRFPFLAVQTPFLFPRTPVLRMEMTSRNDKDKHQAFMLIPHQHFSYIGKIFLVHHCTSIALRFDTDAIQVPAIREELLHCCRDSWGSHSVKIRGIDSPSVWAYLVDIMTTPIPHIEEHLERANKYQQRAAGQSNQGLFMDACRTYNTGALYVSLSWRRKAGANLIGLDSHHKMNLREMEVEFLIELAYCLIKAVVPKKARYTLDSILANGGHASLAKQQEVRIHYLEGLAFVAEGDDIEALKEFRMVLSLKPGHEGADKEVNSMEARLHKMPQTKKCEIEAYLRELVKPHRHRERVSAVLSEAEKPVNDVPD